MKSLTISTPHDFSDRKELARAISGRWEILDDLDREFQRAGNALVLEALLQGQDLLRLKAGLDHGQWQPWCEINLGPRMHKAQKCMRLAANLARAPDLIEAQSMREALQICGEPSTPPAAAEPAEKTERPWPPSANLATMKLFDKWLDALHSTPLSDCSEAIRQRYRERLEPVNRELHPDKFA